MQKSLFRKCWLFSGIDENEIDDILPCLKAEEKEFKKGAYIYRIGDKVHCLGFVAAGSVNIIKDDVWGNAQILDNVTAGQIFAETYACLGEVPMMVNVQAAEQSKIIFLEIGRLFHNCQPSCPYHSRLIQNLLRVLASKNLNLARKIDLLTPKAIRERVMIYLSWQAVEQGKNEFDIPFNRQQLADYLSVERSALSNELSKLKKEGLIGFRKNHFSVSSALFSSREEDQSPRRGECRGQNEVKT